LKFYFHLPNYRFFNDRFFNEVHQWTLVSIKGNMAFSNGLEILLVILFFVCAKFCIVYFKKEYFVTIFPFYENKVVKKDIF